MKEWGSAHSLFHTELFRKLIFFCGSQIEFEKIQDWGEPNILYSKVHSLHLPPGYHGSQDIILESGKMWFKLDCDV